MLIYGAINITEISIVLPPQIAPVLAAVVSKLPVQTSEGKLPEKSIFIPMNTILSILAFGLWRKDVLLIKHKVDEEPQDYISGKNNNHSGAAGSANAGHRAAHVGQ